MRCMRITFAISFLIASAALAQSVKVGVIGGVPLTDPVRFNDESKRYLVGPSVEVRFLDGRPGVEMNALYRRTGTAFSFVLALIPITRRHPSDLAVAQWDIHGNFRCSENIISGQVTNNGDRSLGRVIRYATRGRLRRTKAYSPGTQLLRSRSVEEARALTLVRPLSVASTGSGPGASQCSRNFATHGTGIGAIR